MPAFRVSSRPPYPVLLVLLLCLVAPSSRALAALPPDDVDVLIVTSGQLAGEFQRLADFQETQGLTARVVLLPWIASAVDPGRDEQETVRNLIVAAHAEWGTRYVLIGGDAGVVPVRYIHSEFYPPGGGTDIPADLYYAGLDGDWDADGDGIYGEPYVDEANPGDDADLMPDVALGRAPVNDVDQAAVFVDKAIRFAEAVAPAAPDRALLLAEVLFPSNWSPGEPITLDGADLAEELLPLFAGANPPWDVARLYENDGAYPGSFPLDHDAAVDSLASGRYRLVHHVGHGSFEALSVGDDPITAADVAELTNAPHEFILSSWFGYASAAFDSTTLIERMLWHPDGGCVAGVGGSRATFPIATQDLSVALLAAALQPGARLGDAFAAVYDDLDPDALARETVTRWTALTATCLGDPTLPVSTVALPVAVDGAPRPVRMAIDARPNPFNPRVQVRFDIAGPGIVPVRVEVVDLTGRRVATLLRRALAAGPQVAEWDGRDADGRAVPTGVYVARVIAGESTATTKLTLVR